MSLQICGADPEFQKVVNRWLGVARNWDEPPLHSGISPPDATG
jgi:hypothetical protein